MTDPSLSKDENDTHLKLLYSWPPEQSTDILLNICGFGESIAAYSAQWGRNPAHTLTLGSTRYTILQLTDVMRVVVLTPSAARAEAAFAAIPQSRRESATLPAVWSPFAPAVGALTGSQISQAMTSLLDLIRAMNGNFDVFREKKPPANIQLLLNVVSHNGLPSSLIDGSVPPTLTPPAVLTRIHAYLQVMSTSMTRVVHGQAQVGRWAVFGRTTWNDCSEASGILRCIYSGFSPADTAEFDALFSICPPTTKVLYLQPDRPPWAAGAEGPILSPAFSHYILDGTPTRAVNAARGVWEKRTATRLLMLRSASLIFLSELVSAGDDAIVNEIQIAAELTNRMRALFEGRDGSPLPLPGLQIVNNGDIFGSGSVSSLPYLFPEPQLQTRSYDGCVRFCGGVRFSMCPPAVGLRTGILRADAPLVLYHNMEDTATSLSGDERYQIRVWVGGKAAIVAKTPYGYSFGFCAADMRNPGTVRQVSSEFLKQLRDFFV